MLPQITASRLFRHSFGRKAVAATALAAALLLPGVAGADTESIEVVQVTTKKIYVLSNGSVYHDVPFGPIVVDVRIRADAEVSGWILSWKAYLQIVNADNIFIDLEEAAVSKSYPQFHRPKKVDRIETIAASQSLWKHQVKAMCNGLADDLRADGLSSAEIFAQDRTFNLMVQPVLEVSASGATGLQQAYIGPGYSESGPQIEVVCRKWGGSQIPQASTGMTTLPAQVVNSGLTIIEHFGISGVCKIRLDGWFTTDHKGVNVSYRFETYDGKKSHVESANTGESKTATFSRWEEIANEPSGNETGKVRLVGVSHDFQTDWVDYHLECSAGGPSTIVSNSPPLLTMAVVPHGAVMVQGRICPQVVKLVGVMTGRGNFSGHALFFGPGYISPLRDYSITHGEKVLIGVETELDWDNIALPLPNATLGQAREFGFNVTDEDDNVIAFLPKKSHFIECRKPQLNPIVGRDDADLTTGSNDPVLPATIPQAKGLETSPPPPPRQRLQRRLIRPSN
ncbi:MAG: hypothetical protein ACFCUW_14320 [Kiloniellaceae bacterium]